MAATTTGTAVSFIPSDLPLSPHPSGIQILMLFRILFAGLQARSAAMLFDPGGLFLHPFEACERGALTDDAPWTLARHCACRTYCADSASLNGAHRRCQMRTHEL
jgi:hypothetical protein